MNETLNTITRRYSCRNYKDMAVEKEKLKEIALAAVKAPSAMNSQPWQIVVLTDKTMIDDMDKETMKMLSLREDKSVYDRITKRGGKLFYNAPCIFFVAIKEDAWLDCGIAAQNIALAATSLGLGNVICKLAGLAFETKKKEEYKKKLIPEGYEFGVAVLVGYENTNENNPHTPDLNKIVYIE